MLNPNFIYICYHSSKVLFRNRLPWQHFECFLLGYISVKTTAVAEACVVARMARLVEEAQNNKSKTQRYVDEFAKYYTPGINIFLFDLQNNYFQWTINGVFVD